jgi:integrase
MQLTARAVAALQMPASKTDHIEWDDALPGFGYRLRSGAGGKVLRSWVVQYRRAGGTRRITLGNAAVLSVEQARKEAKKALGRVAIGEDPQADRIDRRGKDQHSFRSVAEEYLKAKQPNVRPRTFVESVRYLTGGYLKALHGMPVDTVTRKDIASRLTVIMRESGNVTAARVRAVLNAFYVWAMQMGYVEQNPTIGSVKPKDSEGRERVLTDDELAAIWSVCDDRDDYSRIVRLLILTACRRQEVGGMRWSELDADAGTWTIPAERTKNGCEHTLPLPSAAWDIITTVPHVVNRDHLFGIRSQGFKSWGDGKAELDKRLGDSVEPFVLHDIRRTVATMMAEGAEEEEGSDTKQDQSDDGRRLGIEPHIIEAILNHQSGHKAGPAGTYNRAKYRRQIRIALALWADHVRALAEGGERKVLNFSGVMSATAP